MTDYGREIEASNARENEYYRSLDFADLLPVKEPTLLARTVTGLHAGMRVEVELRHKVGKVRGDLRHATTLGRPLDTRTLVLDTELSPIVRTTDGRPGHLIRSVVVLDADQFFDRAVDIVQDYLAAEKGYEAATRSQSGMWVEAQHEAKQRFLDHIGVRF